MINENLRHEDLKDVVLNKISIDEFEPKTGEKENVGVIGFYAREKSVAEDLANFLEKGKLEMRDVEVTPNPNPDNFYMVFVELDRTPSMIENIKSLAKDILNITGKLEWQAKPLLSDNVFSLDDPSLLEYVKQTPEEYVTREEYEVNMNNQRTNKIIEFILNNTNALDVTLEENTLNIKDYKNNIKLELVNFGQGQNTLQESGLSDLAIDYDFDRHLIKVLESMRGTLNIIPINRNIVLHNPNTDEILITKPC